MKGLDLVEDGPKSEESRHGLTLPPDAVGALTRYGDRQAFERKKPGLSWADRGLLFCNAISRPLEAGNLKRRSYWPLLERVGLPRTGCFHDLRHSTASIMMELGASLRAI